MTSADQPGTRPVVCDGGTAGWPRRRSHHPAAGQRTFSVTGTVRQRARGIVDTAEEHHRRHRITLATEQAVHTVDWLNRLGFDSAPECPAIMRGHEPT